MQAADPSRDGNEKDDAAVTLDVNNDPTIGPIDGTQTAQTVPQLITTTPIIAEAPITHELIPARDLPVTTHRCSHTEIQ